MSGDLIAILVFVMPGLVGAGTYRLLTVGRKLDQFDFTLFSFVLTVSSLLLTAFIQLQFNWSWGIGVKLVPIAELLRAFDSTEFARNEIYKIIVEYLFSIGFVFVNLVGFSFGVLLSKGINSGRLYNLLRELNLTKKTGRVDVWQDLFAESLWIVVTDNQGQNYLGYASYYSDVTDPDKRELILGQCVELRLSSDGKSYDELPFESELIYLKISDIRRIEKYNNK
ncbi:MAG: DUF6338 family protein [Alphaproteobacteria bacterium]|nr:DUF6338 family protein [Alphaproteobacteria bacterium]